MCDGVGENELDVRFGTSCDNACPFCINHIGRPAQKFNLEKIIETTLAEGKRDCINIVGGEPLLPCRLDDLYTFIKAVRPITKSICIITSLPQIPAEKQELFEKILDLTDDLIISLQHFNNLVNNKLMNASNKYNRIQALIDLSKSQYSAKLNVTLNISSNGINNEEKLAHALKFFDSLGIKYVRLNELGNTPLHISMREVMPEYKFKSPYAHGCSVNVTKYLIRKYKLKNIKTIKARIRCFMIEPSEEASKADLFKAKIQLRALKRAQKHHKVYKYTRHRHTVVYEDGTVSFAWQVYTK